MALRAVRIDHVEQRLRAKYLRESGVHRGNVVTLLPSATPDSAPEQVQYAARAVARERVADLLRGLMARAGVSSGDVGAALDMTEQRVRRMRAGELPLEVAHLLVLEARVPALRDLLAPMRAAVEVLEARARGEAGR